ncbi:MAG: lipid A biosynthesis acyltransferase [Anaeromyxobacteraceae bacterium]
MAASPWKRARRAARAAVIVAFAGILARIPLSVALAVGAALGRAAWWASPGVRRDMRASLAVAFPERTAAERDALARASLVNLGRTMAEVVTLPRWLDRLDGYVAIAPETLEAVRAARARGKGIVLVFGHIGNWELTCRLSPEVQPNAAIAKRSWHPRLDAWAEAARARTGVQTFWRDDRDTGRKILRLFREGGTLGLLIDQDIGGVQNVWVPFFGRPAATPRGAAEFALRFGAAVLVLTCHRRPEGGHRLEVVEVPYDADAPDHEAEVLRLTAACAAVQEAAIRRHPTEWVWMHQRWKTPPPHGSPTA